MINEKNFFVASKATFTECEAHEIEELEATQPNYISINPKTQKPSSTYWWKDGVLYRKSDHWVDVSCCTWYLITRVVRSAKVDQIRSSDSSSLQTFVTYSHGRPVEIYAKVLFSNMHWIPKQAIVKPLEALIELFCVKAGLTYLEEELNKQYA